jgi:cytochrome c-type biogenesis protein
MLTIALIYLAGVLTFLSPCVLPVLPFIVGSSLQRSKLGPLVLAVGMIISFTFFGGIIVATGSFAGLEQETIRKIAGVVMFLAGVILLSKKTQELIAKLLSPLANNTEKLLQKTDKYGMFYSQLLIGMLLGILWSPCTGPTLGASMALAAKDGISANFILSMFSFSLGAATPLLLIAYGAQSLINTKKGSLINLGAKMKFIFGLALIIVGIISFTGIDKLVETWILDLLPEWLIELSVRY